MAAVIVRRLIFLTILLILTGCDTFYGPVITNGFGSEVRMTVVYSDGAVSRTTWPPCRAVFIGRKGERIVRISFERGGRVLRQFSADEILAMTKKEAEVRGNAQWSIGPSGARLDVGTEQSGCPSH